MALLADIEFIKLELEKTILERQSLHWVHVTHIINPHNFYVRKTDYLPFIEKIESNKPLVKCSSVKIHDFVIVNMSESNEVEKYARGKIIQMNKESGKLMSDVFLLDYGDIKKLVPIENIWICDQELHDLPQLTLFCQLANCAPIGGSTEWTQKAIEAFKFYVGTERARINIQDKTMSQLIVELYNTAPDDIATLLALTGFSTLGYVKNDCSILL